MIDSHAHLYFERFDEDRDAVILNAREAGISSIINIGIDCDTSQAAIDLARENEGFFAAVGIHPTSPIEDLDESLQGIHDLIKKNSEDNSRVIVAIGEIGLDFYWKDVPPAEQYAKLRQQLAMARDLELPVIFHCRDAIEELLGVLDEEQELPPGVFHCFSGSSEDARRALDMGFHISFAGNVTYPKATDLRECAASVPPEKILLETDCPFLPPQEKRGKRNEPAFLVYTRDFLASVYGMSGEDLGEMAEGTTRRLFGI